MSGVVTVSVATMSAVHEHVHERTQQKRQPDQRAQNVRAVLGEQKHAGNHCKAE
jgi:hypothetical protein